MKIPFREQVSTFLWTWQEVLLWIPLAFLLVYGFNRLSPYLDPNAGIDGYGDIYVFLVNIFKAVCIFFLAWFFKKTYWFDLPRYEERSTHEAIVRGESRGEGETNDMSKSKEYKFIVVKDRLETLALLVLIAWITGAIR